MSDEPEDAGVENDSAPAEGESWTNPILAELERRKAEVLAMPGYQLKVDLEALGRAGRPGRPGPCG